MLEDKEYDEMFSGDSADAHWSFLCLVTSHWLTSRTGLPIDFQIQRMTQANAMEGKTLRSALGIVDDYGGDKPTRVRASEAGV